jgi:hypothetical protein
MGEKKIAPGPLLQKQDINTCMLAGRGSTSMPLNRLPGFAGQLATSVSPA